MSGAEEKPKNTDEQLNKAWEGKLKTGYEWFRGIVCSPRKIARIKKKEAYDARVAERRAKGLNS